MAVGTTTVFDSQILTEALGAFALPSASPKVVLANHINSESIDGMATKTKQYAVDADIGAAAAVAEGSAISNTTPTKGTAVTISPAENAAIRFDFTDQALRRKMPGLTAQQVLAVIESGDVIRFAQMAGPEASRMVKAGQEKVEDDVANLITSGTNTVGSTGVDLLFSVALDAIYTQKTLEADNEDLIFGFTPNQLRELRADLAGTNGAASVFNSQADLAMFNVREDVNKNGFAATLLGVPVYEYSHSLRTTLNAGADVGGVLMCRGEGAPDTAGAKVGALALVEGAPPLWRLDYTANTRTAELIYTLDYAVGMIDDNRWTIIVSDAP